MRMPHHARGPTLVALTYQKPKGEVGCEALSPSHYEHWHSRDMETECAETPPDEHLKTASANQNTNANIFQIAISACNDVGGCCEPAVVQNPDISWAKPRREGAWVYV